MHLIVDQDPFTWLVYYSDCVRLRRKVSDHIPFGIDNFVAYVLELFIVKGINHVDLL